MAAPWIALGTCSLAKNGRARREGMVLIIVLWIILGLVTVVLLFAEGMRMEYKASTNATAALQAGQALEGARRYLAYVLSDLATPGEFPTSDLYEAEDVPVGDATFWVIGRADEDLAEADIPVFGLIDEASKLNLNTATREMIELLPNMTPDVAAAILDWRNSPDNPQPDGAESDFYMAGDPAYMCKNAPFESVEELRWVRGVTRDLLYGADTNRNGILDPGEKDADAIAGTTNISSSYSAFSRGLLDFVTVVTREPNVRADGSPRADVRRPKNTELDALLHEKLGAGRAAQIEAAIDPQAANIGSVLEFYLVGAVTAAEAPLIENAVTANDGDYVQGRVNVNTAPREVLVCLPGIGEQYADAIIAARRTKTEDELDSVIWVNEVLDRTHAVLAGPYITTRSFQVGADVAALGKGGRGLRRSWMIFDTMGAAPVVVYRCDESYLGWPLGTAWDENQGSPSNSEDRGTEVGRNKLPSKSNKVIR